MIKHKCEYCHDTGWYGDNGPGRKGNREYHPCDMCEAGRTSEPLEMITSAELYRLRARVAELEHQLDSLGRLVLVTTTLSPPPQCLIDEAKAALKEYGS